MRATRFAQLIEDEELPMMILHIHAITSESTQAKKPKSNSGGYKAQVRKIKKK
jgi:hypothetical protein